MKYFFINLIIATIFISCSNSKKIRFTDFPQTYSEVLIPIDGVGYTTAGYEIRGITNDTIIIKFYGLERRYSGEFEDKLYPDYYGGMDVNFEFDSYKADNGSVHVKYGIY